MMDGFCFVTTASPVFSLWHILSLVYILVEWMGTFNTYFAGIISREKMIRMCMCLRLYTILPVSENFLESVHWPREARHSFSRKRRAHCSWEPDGQMCQGGHPSVALHFSGLHPFSFFQILHQVSFSACFRGLPGYFLLASKTILSLTTNDLKELIEPFRSMSKWRKLSPWLFETGSDTNFNLICFCHGTESPVIRVVSCDFIGQFLCVQPTPPSAKLGQGAAHSSFVFSCQGRPFPWNACWLVCLFS